MGLASALSLAATGLSAFGEVDQGDTAAANARTQAQNAINQAQATSTADQFRSQTLSDQAEYGRVAATQTDTDMRLALQSKLANISAVRAAGDVDPNSPTGFAITNRTEAVGDIDRQQRVGNIGAQVLQDQLASGYYATAGATALQAGYANAAQLEENAGADQTTGFLGALGSSLSKLSGLAGLVKF